MSFGHQPSGEIAGSYGGFILTFWRKFHAVSFYIPTDHARILCRASLPRLVPILTFLVVRSLQSVEMITAPLVFLPLALPVPLSTPLVLKGTWKLLEVALRAYLGDPC